MPPRLPPGYRWREGTLGDRALLIEFARQTYGELFPNYAEFDHLTGTIEAYFSTATPLWWVETSTPAPVPVGLVWAGTAIDQASGERHLHILLLYVDSAHRRRGLGTALVRQAEDLARARGDRHLGLQTFTHNRAALQLYERMGYRSQALHMCKDLTDNGN